MLDTAKLVKTIFLLLVFHYLLYSFIGGDFNPMNFHGAARGFMVILTLVSIGATCLFLSDNGFFEKETKIQKETKLKKYIGELNEELELYAEAKSLEKKISELQNKKY